MLSVIPTVSEMSNPIRLQIGFSLDIAKALEQS
jgi:hypothetical protein